MSRTIFTKYSNERRREFSIRTDILLGKSGKVVRKTAVYPEALGHIQKLALWQEKLSRLFENSEIQVNRLTMEDGQAFFEYVDGVTLEETLDRLLRTGKQSEAQALLVWYLDWIRDVHTGQAFFVTEEFEKVFGEQSVLKKLEGTLAAAPVTDIDLVCANLLLGEKKVLLDYEWTFDFPVPALFVIYRVIHYYFETMAERKCLPVNAFYESYGISRELEEAFSDMERHFQKYIEGDYVPVRTLYTEDGVLLQKNHHGECMQIYFGIQGKLNERDSVTFPVLEHEAHAEVRIPENCTFLRIDPLESACAVEFTRFCFDGKPVEISGFPIENGILVGNWGYFAEEDPAMVGIPVPEGAKTFQVSMGIEPLPAAAARQIVTELKRKAEAENTLLEINRTKIWRFYRRYRDFVERKKK